MVSDASILPAFPLICAEQGINRLINSYKKRVMPEGASWMLSSAGCLFWLFVIEVITGLLMMSVYSPSVPSAWASVHHIQELPGGKFIRGLHYYNSQALIILFTIHTIRVLLMASFRKPREIIWMTGILIAPAMIPVNRLVSDSRMTTRLIKKRRKD